MSPGWQSRASQMASRVEKRIAFAFPVFKIERFAIVIPTFSESSVMLIFRFASITSRFTSIDIEHAPFLYGKVVFALENGGFVNKVGKGGANDRNCYAHKNYKRSANQRNARVAHIHKNERPVSEEKECGISSRKSGDYFKIFGVIKAEGIIVSDIFGYFPAEEKGNETGNRAEPKENLPGPIAIGNLGIHCFKAYSIGGNKPAENDKAENSGSDYDSFKPF